MLLSALGRTAGLPEEQEVRVLVTRLALYGEDEEGHLLPLEKLT